ncbi:MAG: hypothetical protein U5L04_14395 [Trueperaceae bacterium]|nr:hypothetical protein [Trueperaceae bacterium]
MFDVVLARTIRLAALPIGLLVLLLLSPLLTGAAQPQHPFGQQLGTLPEQLGAERVPCRVYGLDDAQACFEYRSPLVVYAMARLDRALANLPNQNPWTQQPSGDYQKRYTLNIVTGATLDVTLRQLDPYTVFGVLRYPATNDAS